MPTNQNPAISVSIAALSGGVAILFSVLAVMVSLLLIALLVWSILREQKRFIRERTDGERDETGRSKFDSRLDMYVSERQEFTLYMIEIIEQTEMKKTLGDFQFDSAIELFLKRLRRVFSGNISLSVDGDKILILSAAKVSSVAIEKICNLIIYEASSPVLLGGTLNVYFDISIGVASYPYSGKTVHEIVDNAQVALLTSKRTGYNHFVIYDSELGSSETEEYKNYLEIKEAIKNNEFTLYYQPIVDTISGEVFAVETLLRWNHKTRGVLSPMVFLNILEQSGDINWVGQWSFEQLIKQREAWQKSYPEHDFLVSINVSQKQIRSKDIVEEVRRIVKRHHVPYNQIILEIIEPAALSSEEVVTNNINRLSQLGIKIAIDNYGADFVSLHKLENLNINMIKLDKKFFSQSMDESGVNKGILDLLISFCFSKNISLVCMNLETEEELVFARQNNIRYAQGFHFAKPTPPKEVMQEIILTPWK